MLLPNMPFVAITALWWIVLFEKTPSPGVHIMPIETGRQVWRIYNKHNIEHGSKYSSHFVTEVTEIILQNCNMLTFKPLLHLRRRRSWHSVLFSLTVFYEPRQSDSCPVVFDHSCLPALDLHRYLTTTTAFLTKSRQGSLLTTLRVGRVGENSGNEVSVFDGVFPEKYKWKTIFHLILPMPLGHPIILLGSN